MLQPQRTLWIPDRGLLWGLGLCPPGMLVLAVLLLAASTGVCSCWWDEGGDAQPFLTPFRTCRSWGVEPWVGGPAVLPAADRALPSPGDLGAQCWGRALLFAV